MKPTLDPIAIQSLTFLTRQQAQVFCAMDDVSFRRFIARREVPFSCDDPSSPKSKRRFSRALLEKAMLADMHPAAHQMDEHATNRILQIVGDEK